MVVSPVDEIIFLIEQQTCIYTHTHIVAIVKLVLVGQVLGFARNFLPENTHTLWLSPPACTQCHNMLTNSVTYPLFPNSLHYN